MTNKAPPPPSKKAPPPPPGAERRRHERIEALAQVELSASGEVVIVPIVNISAGGVLVALEHVALPKVGPGDAVSVFIDLGPGPDGSELAVSLEGEVVRFTAAAAGKPATLAAMWTSSDPAAAETLVEVLMHLRKQTQL